MMSDITNMKDEELEAAQRALWTEGKALKAKRRAIARELDSRVLRREAAKFLGGLSPDHLAQVLSGVGGIPSQARVGTPGGA